MGMTCLFNLLNQFASLLTLSNLVGLLPSQVSKSQQRLNLIKRMVAIYGYNLLGRARRNVAARLHGSSTSHRSVHHVAGMSLHL